MKHERYMDPRLAMFKGRVVVRFVLWLSLGRMLRRLILKGDVGL